MATFYKVLTGLECLNTGDNYIVNDNRLALQHPPSLFPNECVV